MGSVSEAATKGLDSTGGDGQGNRVQVRSRDRVLPAHELHQPKRHPVLPVDRALHTNADQQEPDAIPNSNRRAASFQLDPLERRLVGIEDLSSPREPLGHFGRGHSSHSEAKADTAVNFDVRGAPPDTHRLPAQAQAAVGGSKRFCGKCGHHHIPHSHECEPGVQLVIVAAVLRDA